MQKEREEKRISEDGRCAEGDRTVNIVGMVQGERVDVSMISSLFDGELARLGVGTMGDRHRLSTHQVQALFSAYLFDLFPLTGRLVYDVRSDALCIIQSKSVKIFFFLSYVSNGKYRVTLRNRDFLSLIIWQFDNHQILLQVLALLFKKVKYFSKVSTFTREKNCQIRQPVVKIKILRRVDDAYKLVWDTSMQRHTIYRNKQ